MQSQRLWEQDSFLGCSGDGGKDNYNSVRLTTKQKPILKRQVTWHQIIPFVESNNKNSEGFKTCLRRVLVLKTFHSGDEFMECRRWDN